MEKKYKLTKENISYCGRTLYRIEALKDFANVKKGDKGGYVESEENLSQEGNCWISNNAKVYDSAVVYNNAEVYDNAQVCDNAKVYDSAKVYDNAEVCDYARVYDNAIVYGKALVYDNTKVFGKAEVCGNVVVCDKVKVFDDAFVYDNAIVCGNAQVCGTAEIKNNSDYIIFKNWWSSGRHFTWTRSNNMWKVGCFYGTGEELIKKAYKDSELSGREYERIVNYVESILQDNKVIED